MNQTKGHSKFEGVVPVTQTINLISDTEGPLVQATVVTSVKQNGLYLQLDYWTGDPNIIDNRGYINVRWTKQDLQRMLNLIELAESVTQNEQTKENK